MKICNHKSYIFIFLYILLLCALFSSCNSKDIVETVNTETPANTIQNTPAFTTEPTATIEPTPTMEPYTQIILGSTGDIMCHTMQLMDAQNAAEGDNKFTKSGDELYSFDHWFEFIKPSLEYADLMIGNLETTIALDNSLVSGYPFFATPKEILPDLKEAGFDVLLSGNNHILDKEQAGLISTVNALEDADIFHTGAWTSLENQNTPLVVDVKGIKVGIISATSSVNEQDRHLTEEEKAYMYLYIDNLSEISQQIANCKNAGAEVIVVCPHWGYQDAIRPNASMAKLAQEYVRMGADIIFAHHPHVLQPVDKIQVTLEDGGKREGIVFWSLGNFVSNQMNAAEKLTSVIAYVTVTRDNASGKITIDSASYLPIWTYIAYSRETNSKSYYVLPAGQVLDYPEVISTLNPPSLKTPLNNAWILATKRLGKDAAKPQRSVPLE